MRDEAEFLSEIVKSAVASTLMELGVKACEVSYRKGVQVYGQWFVHAVAEGRLKPISQGEGPNGRMAFLVRDIHILKAEESHPFYDTDILKHIPNYGPLPGVYHGPHRKKR